MLAMYGVSVAAAVIIYSSYIIILGYHWFMSLTLSLCVVHFRWGACRSSSWRCFSRLSGGSPAAHKSIAGGTSRIADGKIVIEFAAAAAAVAAGVDEPEEEYQRGMV